MKTSKNLLKICLSLALATSLLVVPSYAATDTEKESMAKALYSINLFQGYDNTGTNFGLKDVPTREQALIFQIRALGEDAAAQAWRGNSPYVDVPSNHWAVSYIGYAAEKGYTSGIGNGKFGLGDPSNAQAMTTFILRGLGYSDGSASDFSYNNSLTFGKSLGINETDVAPSRFTRGDAVVIIYRALNINTKNSGVLATTLIGKGVFTQASYDAAIKMLTPSGKVDPTNLTLDKNTMTLKVGESYDLTAKVAPTNAKISLTWKSSNPAVASVGSSGLVKALKAGTSTVTVTSYNGLTANCNVTVAGAASQDKVITVNFVNMTGKTFTKLYSSASEDKDWGSSLISGSLANNDKAGVEFTFNTNAAKFDLRADISGGDYYEFKGLNLSNVANNTTYYLYLSGSTPMISATKPSAASVEPTGLSVDKSTLNMKVGESYDITAKVAPTGAKISLTWKSSNPAVASVGSSGLVKALKAGTSTVTVTSYNGLTANCNVTVAGAASQDKVITVNFVNMTGKAFTKLYSSASEDGDWGSSLISGSLANNDKAGVEFTFNTSAAKFDLRADISGGEYYEFKGLNLSNVANNTTYYLYLNGSTPMISATKPSTTTKPDVPAVVNKTVNLYNSTDRALSGIFVSSSKNSEWSKNLMNISVLDINKSTQFIVPVSTGDTKFDLNLTDTDGNEMPFAAYDFKDFDSGSTLYAYLENGIPTLGLKKPTAQQPEETTRKINVTFVNDTNKEFTGVYAVPTENSGYGSNLGKLASTSEMPLEFTVPSETNQYKIKITTADDAYELNNITFDKGLKDGSSLSIVFSADNAGNMTWEQK